MTLHAIQRAKERYGLDLTMEDIDFILSEILSGKAKNVTKPNMFGYFNQDTAHYRLRYKGVLIEPVVKYRNSIPIIATFCPTGKKADRNIKKWLKRYQDENFTHLMRKFGKDRG